LIEAAGLKGTREGAIEVSPLHANYFVNTGGGRADEVRRLIARTREVVQARFGVTLVPEVKLIGPNGELRAP
jgi:UDP-N-acetylmuramate dehydrogenase